jgi:hypothetical protein
VSDAIDWLPPEAFTADRVRGALEQIVGDWSVRWFAGRLLAISSVDPCSDNSQPRVEAKGGVIRAVLDGKGERNMVEALLGVDLGKVQLQESDHRVLDALAKGVLEDLVSELERHLGKGRDAQLAITLGFAGRDSVVLEVPRCALVPLIKARQTRGPGSGTKPVRPGTALAASEICLDGILGEAAMSVTEVAGLAVGDVLVLDRGLHEPVEVRLGGRVMGYGKLTQREGRTAVQF